MSATAIHVSNVASIEDASLSYASISAWVESHQGQQFVDLLRRCWRTRAYGDFWSYMLLAEGAVDIACEPELALHDMAACSIIATEAGGKFTDLDARPGPRGTGGYATNGRLHYAVLQQLASTSMATTIMTMIKEPSLALTQRRTQQLTGSSVCCSPPEPGARAGGPKALRVDPTARHGCCARSWCCGMAVATRSWLWWVLRLTAREMSSPVRASQRIGV
jgi:hypothetical protein